MSVWPTKMRQSQTHARHVEMETCNDQTMLRKTDHYTSGPQPTQRQKGATQRQQHYIAEPCLSTKTPASQHHNQKHHSNRACVDESILPRRNTSNANTTRTGFVSSAQTKVFSPRRNTRNGNITRTGFVSPPFTKRSAVTPPRRSRGRHIPAPPPATCGVEYEVCRVTFKALAGEITSATTSHRAQAELIASNIQTHGRLLLSPLTALGVTAVRACTAAAVEKLARVKKSCGWNKLCFSKFLKKTPGKKRYPQVSEDAPED